MKRLFALVMVLCLLCISLAGCGAKAKEPSEEEYLAWAEKAWNVIKEVYENYRDVPDFLTNCHYIDSEGKKVYPNLDFLLIEDIRTLSQVQYDAMNKLGFTDVHKEEFDYIRFFFVEIGNDIKTAYEEYQDFDKIPESCDLVDSNISPALEYIKIWHDEICSVIKEGYSGWDISDKMMENGIHFQLEMSGITEEEIMEISGGTGIVFSDNIKELGINKNVKTLYALLG